jgi:hypothetical protein
MSHPTLEICAYALMVSGALGGAALLWNRNDRAAIGVLIAVALIARLLLISKAPFLSDDAYRYLWDGRMLLHGINPYVYAPDSPLLASFRSTWLYPYIYWNHAPSLYPPLDLALFAVADWLSDRGLIAIKVLVEIGDVAAIALIMFALRRRGLPLGRAALYAWAPLTILEFGWSAHEDAWCVAAVLAAIVLLDGEKKVASGLALAAAILVKLFPLAFAPILFARRGWAAGLTCFACVILAYVPFYLWNPNVLGFLHDWVAHFQHNDSLFIWVGQGGAAALFAAAVTGAFFARMRGAGLPETLVFLLLAYLLLSPSVWPWYLAGFLALLPLVPHAFENSLRPMSLGVMGWIAMSPLGYAAQALPLAHIVEYVPLAVGIVLYLRNVVTERVLTFEPAG